MSNANTYSNLETLEKYIGELRTELGVKTAALAECVAALEIAVPIVQKACANENIPVPIDADSITANALTNASALLAAQESQS